MNRKKWAPRLSLVALAMTAVIGVAAAAGQGGKSDPLVTLSYLNEKATPEILAEVDRTITEREKDYQKQLEKTADDYRRELEQALDSAGGQASSSFEVVTLKAGQRLTAGASCELLLRSGTGVCVSDSAPGLVDMTSGGTLASGGVLTANHLYLATIEGRGLVASTDVTVMVRGVYEVR